ncbi:glycine--tRNA ligase subunit alpha [Candidatus Acetothermia bacterium]|nr:glycine--tRNA ligase subunit alpha [Candidatus Acetothermia bacterium]MBI3644200.1 glycine--tRNA ligase subunit alpha [Candidatus Acetothermia bacterium]
MNFQELLLGLQVFWQKQGCVLEQPYDIEVGAGTFHPATFFGVLRNSPWKAAYVEPSRRPTDGRYGDNPIRMQIFYQYQVILKPAPDNVQDLYLQSLESVGAKLSHHDVRFEKDDWKSPTLGASGLGWQVVLDGIEISQFTYFQQMGGFELPQIPCELTYGTERIAMALQNVSRVWDLKWNDELTYGEIKLQQEREGCTHNFEKSDAQTLFQLFDIHEAESKRLLSERLIFPSYEHLLKCSHTFNLLDARRAISTTERERYIYRIQTLARGCAKAFVKSQKEAEKTTAEGAEVTG